MREETGRKRRWGEEWGKRCRIRFGEGQEKWPDSQDNEWNSANDRVRRWWASPGQYRDLG